MPANTAPIFTLTPAPEWYQCINPTANNTYDGSGTLGTSIFSIFAAATGGNGARIESVAIKPLGTNAGVSIARIYLNNGATNATVQNNCLLDEVVMAASTASATTVLPKYEIPLGIVIPPDYRILVGFSVNGAAGWACLAKAAEY